MDYSNLEAIDTTKTFNLAPGGSGVKGYELTPKTIEYMIKNGFSIKDFQRRLPVWITVHKKTGLITGIFEQKPFISSINMRAGNEIHNDKFQSNTDIFPWKHIDLPPVGAVFTDIVKKSGGYMPKNLHQTAGDMVLNFGDNAPETEKEIVDFKIYQIYFNTQNQKSLEPAFIPYYNPNCNYYFENSVIVDIHDNKRSEWSNSDYTGVLSHKFWQVTHLHWFDIANRIAATGAKSDVYAFWAQAPHNPVPISNLHHPNFTNIVRRILVDRLGFDKMILEQTYKCFYRNYWITKPHIFSKYVNTFLKPIIQIMEDKSDPELQKWLWSGANYHQYLSRDRMQKIFGQNRKDFTHHTFVLERMPIFFFNLGAYNISLIH